tara:strand:+ start:155 stop:520 length:366 start_codon:yes stop_codon:yes gene_type:complete
MHATILSKGCEVSYWSVIKYKPKKNCEDEFLKNAERLENELGESERLSVWLKTTDGQVVQLICKSSLDAIIETQDIGLDWLDSVDHLLEKDLEGSRTVAYSGFEVDTLTREFGLNLKFTNA